MNKLKITPTSKAKPESKDLLLGVEKKYGFVPNLMSVFADSPSTLKAYLTLSQLMDSTSFTSEEQQAILLAVSFENNCEYCMAAHSMVASKIAGMASSNLQAIRNGSDISDKKLNALVKFTKSVVKNKGFPSPIDQEVFFSVGYTNQHVLEVLLGVAMKTLSNYANHLAKTPIDPAFSEFKWTK